MGGDLNPGLRMPSDFKGPDKNNPCVGSDCCDKGWCIPKQAWAHKVNHQCAAKKTGEISPELVEERRKKHQAIDQSKKSAKAEYKPGPKGRPVRCIDTGKVYPSSVAASKATKLHQGSVSKCCSGIQKTAGGMRWEYV